jgi:hypothetical protein
MTSRVPRSIATHIVWSTLLACASLLAVADDAPATPTPTPAATPINCTSGVTNPGDAQDKLQFDYAHGGGSTPCITLTNGESLDLNGHSITAIGDAMPVIAISCTAPGSAITDTANVKGSITGPFINAFYDCENIEGITIQEGANPGFLGWGLFNAMNNYSIPADRIVDNVIDGALYGITGLVKGPDSVISNNYLSDCANVCIAASSTTENPGPLYENNVIRGFSGIGIEGPYSDKVRVRRNLLFDHSGGDFDCITGTATGITSNACDCLDTHCVPGPPYVFPFD